MAAHRTYAVVLMPWDDPSRWPERVPSAHLEVGPVAPWSVEARTYLDDIEASRAAMAKSSPAGRPGKKPRHTAAQKKAARLAREKQAHSQRKGGRGASGADNRRRADNNHRQDRSDERPHKNRWRDRDAADPRGRGSRAEQREGRRRDDDRRDPGRQRTEHTFRARREEREGRPTRRGRHEGRRWDDTRRQRGPGGRFDDRAAAPAEADVERDEADTAYRQRRAAAVAEDAAATVTEDNGFAGLDLHEELVAALARIGISQPFPIQAATIPDALAGRDLLGRGQTGSGKTMAFGLPMLHRLAGLPRAVPHRPRAVILTPTRELAMQIVDALAPLVRAVDRRYLLVAGGMSYGPQLSALERGVDVLVATPGRLIDLVDRGAADLSEVEVMVLDEADHMAEMGFIESIQQLLDLTPVVGQRLLFSATLDHGVDRVAQHYLKNPVTHSTDEATASVTTMEHHVFLVHPHHKKPITAAIANRPGRTLVFCRTKLGVDRVAMQLRESGVFAAALHGGLNQAQRTRVMDAFKAGTLPVLVATDVAARGIHVDDVSLVLQADPPADHKDYLHRSGRTARAGDEGVVVTLALPHQKRQVSRLLDVAGVQTTPRPVAPEDTAVIETAGGSVPGAEPIPQSRLDQILRPRKPQGRPRGGRPGGRYADRGPRSGGRRGDGRGSGGPRGHRDGSARGGYRGDDRGGDRGQRSRGRGDNRPDWHPRG